MKIKFILAFFVLDLFLVANAFAQEPKKGDVTGDGTIGIFDLIEVKDYTNKEMAELSASEQAVADFNSDGRIDELDVADMRNYINSQETQKDRVDFIVRVKFAIDPQTGAIFKPKSVVSTYTGQIAQIEDIVKDFVKSLKVTGQIVDPPCDIGDMFKVKAKWQSISNLDSYQTSVFVNVKKLTNNKLLKEDVNVVTKHVPESCNVFTSTSDIELISCDPFSFSVDLWASAVKISEGLTPLEQADLNVQSSPVNLNNEVDLISVSGKTLAPPCAKGGTYRVTAVWQSKATSNCYEALYAEVAELTNGNTLLSYNLVDGGKDGVLSHGELLNGTFDIRLESCEKFSFKVNLFGSFRCGPFNAGEAVSGPLTVDETEDLPIFILPETTVNILGIPVTIAPITVGDLRVHLTGTLTAGDKANPMTLEARLVPPSETVYKAGTTIEIFGVPVTAELEVIFEERFLLREEQGIIGFGDKRDFRYIECIGNCTKIAGEKDVFKLPFRYNVKFGSIVTITDVIIGVLTLEKPQDKFVCCE